jgi:hypothetical protein
MVYCIFVFVSRKCLMPNLKCQKRKCPSEAGRYFRHFAAAVCLLLAGPTALAVSPDSNSMQPQALNFAGIYAIHDMDPNLTGSGIKFGIVSRSYTYNGAEPTNDYAIPLWHPCFANKQISFFDDGQFGTSISPHAAAVASILFGEDPNGFVSGIGSFYFRGIAPRAKAEVYEFRHFIRDIVFPAKPVDADILSMSLGSQFEDWWTRGVNRIAEANGISIVAGIGNGTNVDDPVLYPGAGPNVLAVGVVDSVSGPNDFQNLANFSLPAYQHSSIGPTVDGRCKPDIVAPGNCIAAAADVNQTYAETGNWSSFSTPIVAGTIGLLMEKAKSDPNLQSAFGPAANCVFKAIVMNSARKLPFWHKGELTKDDDHEVPLDYLQGAGMLDAAAAYKQLIAGPASDGVQKSEGWDNNRITPAASQVYYFNAKAAGQYIAATLVWNRHFQSQYPYDTISEKNSNLRLELWAIDVNNPTGDRLLDYSDSPIDNVEHIYFAAEPNTTNYAISVSFSDPETAEANAVEQFAIAWAVENDTTKNSILWYDLNNDGVVNNADLAVLAKYIDDAAGNPALPYNPRYDVNMDGKIDLSDLRLVGSHSSMIAAWRK